MRISVNCPSYKRPKVETLAYLPFCKVWVCETEADAYRNYEREEEQLHALRRKWGSRIVKFDNSNKGKTKKEKVRIDFNPIIKVPIKGL